MPTSKVFIGKNGIGKSTVLERLSKKDNNSFLCTFSSKENAPDNFPKQIDKTLFWKDLTRFITKVGSYPIKIDEGKNGIINKKMIDILKDDSSSKQGLEELKNDSYLSGIFKLKNNEKLKEFIVSNPDKEINYPFIKVDNLARNLKLDDFGTGRFVYLLIKIIFVIFEYFLNTWDSGNKNKTNFTVIIDEPENFLHPSLIREVAYMLRKINKKINVIIATHSAEFLTYFAETNTEILFLTTQQEKEKGKKFTEKEFQSVFLEEHIKELNLFTREQSFNALMASKIIFVEGENDKKLVDHIIRNSDVLCEDQIKITRDVYVFVCDGKYKLPILHKKLKNMCRFTPKQDFYILYDQDNVTDLTEKIESKLKKYFEYLKKTYDFNNSWNELNINWPKIVSAGNPLNTKIENCDTYAKYGFKYNLEKYFGIKEKKHLDPNSIPPDKIKTFIKDSNLGQFLERSY